MADYTAKTTIREGWEGYIRELATWQSFVTLTFRDIVAVERLEFNWRYLVQRLNSNLFGNHYTRIVGHSYFAYAMGIEAQKRGALHAHALVDRRINFELVHSLWGAMAGFAFIKPVDDQDTAISYLSKYVTKGGEIAVYKPVKVKEPAFKPLWYLGI